VSYHDIKRIPLFRSMFNSKPQFQQEEAAPAPSKP
jgi:hypothetical protein